MPDIGKRNRLRVVRAAAPGLYLDGGPLGEILLPGRYIPPGARPGAQLEVFLHRDSEDRLVATTETPHASVGEFALLKVVTVHPRIGAFLDWGLSKDLLLPIREQARAVTAGEAVIAHVFLDPQTGRIVATTRLNNHLDRTAATYADGEKVRLLIAGPTPLGFKAIIENAHWGLLYQSDLAGALELGQKLDGYVRAVRLDGKIDLRLDAAGYQRVALLTERILTALKANGGRLEFDDQSEPAGIRADFDTSKKAFKQALGTLYRQHKIRFTSPGIELVKAARKTS